MKEIIITPVGVVSNEVNDRMDENWSKIKSRIILRPEFYGALEGLSDFSHVIILTYLHQANYEQEKHLQRRPRNLKEMPLIGIFSQRAKNRPNPIGITTVKILDVTKEYLEVSGLDAINKTPVIDIKPYYPQYDKQDDSKMPEWVDRLMKNYF